MAKGLCALLVVLFTTTSCVLSQGSDVTLCIPRYQWSVNSRGQAPCLVGAYLESLCSGTPVFVDSLPLGEQYTGPSSAQAEPCLCNSVTYSVISACAGCQNRTFTDYTKWIQNCPRVVEIGQYPRPIPDGIELPSWASLNISLTNNSFNPLAAEREAERPNASPSATDSVPGDTSITLLPGPPLLPTSSTLSTDSGGLSPGTIAGATLAGILVVVAIVMLLTFWVMLRARRQRNAKLESNEIFSPINNKPQVPVVSPIQHVHARSLLDTASIITPSYSADSRQPVSTLETSIYYSAAGSAQGPNTMLDTQNTAHVKSAGPRGYTGVTEI